MAKVIKLLSYECPLCFHFPFILSYLLYILQKKTGADAPAFLYYIFIEGLFSFLFASSRIFFLTYVTLTRIRDYTSALFFSQ